MKTCLTGWVIEGKAHSTGSAILTRQLRLVRTRETRGIALTVEGVLVDGALLAEIVLETEITPVALKNHIVIPAPPGQGTGMDITLKTRAKRRKPADEEDLSVPWTCEDVDLFTPRIRNFKSSRKTRMPNNVKTYDGTGDPEDHLKIFQAAAQRDGETIKEFLERFKIKTERMKGAPECMRISGFMRGVNNPELTKRLNERVPKTVEEMTTAITAFTRGETAAASKKKVHTSWKSQDQSKRHTSKRRSDFWNQPKDGWGSNKFTPLTRTPKEIFATESRKFKPPPPMVTPVEKRSSNKFCEFHNDKGHDTDECVQLRKQIEELRVTRQKVTQSFAHVKEITFPPLTANKGTEGPLVIEAEIGGHAIHRIYVDGGSSMEVLYEHCFNRLRPEIKNQMVPATSLTGFSGETIWPLGQLSLLVTIGDTEHYTKVWMNFMIVRSPSPYNGIIGRPEIREIQAVPSTAHGMLKFLPSYMRDYHDRLPSIDSISEKDIPMSDKKTGAGPRARQGDPLRGTKTGRGRNSARSILPRLVIQPGHGEEARW
uniref:Reverse transcriptase domain-containing protein n=1 Tax=Tanacetum cinerariifolium TaxID=118510 RepID=A0A6L2NYK9_TANCI|nr:hypothetical protein [Tanacetum cinerariifolium]